MNRPGPIAFEKAEFVLPVSMIIPQRELSPDYKRTVPYRMIVHSLKTTGLIEALVVYPKGPEEYLLLDGHSRLDALKELGFNEVRCTFSTDDEAYTYNSKVNSVSKIGQHFMIRKALESGVSEERLSNALGVSAEYLRKQRDLLDGICPEAAHLLRDKKVATDVFRVMRKMKPIRQVEAVEHMIAGNTYSVAFARALLAVTKPEMLAIGMRKRKVWTGSRAAQHMLAIETERLIKDLNTIEESYGRDVLSLTVCSTYLRRMLASAHIEHHLSEHHSDVLSAIREAIGCEI